MSNIEQEIEQIADSLEKSNQTSKERLFNTIRQMGPEQIKAKLSSLEKSDKELLLEALKEMKKAVEMDKNYAAAKYVQGKITETKIQEDLGDDNADEKLVLKTPEAETVNHQGTPTPGWEGQVIKGKEMSKDKAKDKIMDMEEKEHGTKDPKKLVEAEKKEHADKKMKKSIEILKAHASEFLSMLPESIEDMEKAHVGFKAVEAKAEKEGAEDPAAVAAAVGRKKYGKEGMAKLAEAGKKHMKKSEEDMNKAAECSDKKKRCVREVKEEGKGKNAYAICNASMKKGESITPEVKAALQEIRKSVESQLKAFGVEVTPELVKGEMKRLLKEEDQDGDAPEMNEKTRANKENVAALDMGKDNKEAQKKVNDEKQGMKKSTSWSGEQDLLKANTFGRNHHFSMDEYIDTVLANAGKTEEPVKKSEDKKEDLNDIIAKGGDANWDMVNTERMLKANGEKIKGKFVKSFEENEIAEALGLTAEEAKKILGEK